VSKIESNLYRILDGKISYKEGSFIRDPSFRVKRLGQIVYNEFIDFLEDDVLDDRQIQIALIEHGAWSSEKEKRIKDLPRVIENIKVDYFQNYGNPSVRSSYKSFLEMSIKEFMSLSKIRYRYHYLTADGIASSAMWMEMISHMYLGENKLGALGYYYANSLNEIDIRDVALSNDWGSYSSITKSPLSKSALKMTDYQRKLISWTNIYRNIRSHPEFPGQRIVEDHDAFDGWMILLNRKEAAEKSHKVQMDNLKPNAQNVFMGQATKQDFEEIMSLNSPEIREKIRKEHELNKH
jgi:hypothetical protein